MTATAPTPAWASLLPPALVGTARQTPGPAALPGQAGALAQAISQSPAPAAEQLLRQAALLAVCERASGPPQAQASAPLAPPDQATPLPDAHPFTPHLHWLLSDAPEAAQRLLQEALQQLSACGWQLPHTLLPVALNAGRRSTALRPALLPALGVRGQWLAAQSPDWRYAAAADASDDAPADAADADWHTGTLTQRQAWLSRTRQSDAAAGRAALQAALPDLPASERAALVPLLAHGLSLDDEALLTHLLQKDRSSDVRQAAAALLTALPASAHAQAIAQHMAALLPAPAASAAPAPAPGLLGRALAKISAAVGAAPAPHWLAQAQINPPEAPPPDAKALGLDSPRPKHDSLGERAWRLYQIVRQTPLAWWPAHTGADPAALLLWSKKTDWAEALARGWLDALHASAAAPAANEPLAPWARALLQHGQAARHHWHDARPALLALLPMPEREAFWQAQLPANALTRPDKLDQLLDLMLPAYPPGHILSEPLARALLAQVHSLLAHKALHSIWALRPHLAALPGLLPATVLPAVAQLPRHEDEPEGLRQALNDCQRAAAARAALLALQPPPNAPSQPT